MLLKAKYLQRSYFSSSYCTAYNYITDDAPLIQIAWDPMLKDNVGKAFYPLTLTVDQNLVSPSIINAF